MSRIPLAGPKPIPGDKKRRAELVALYAELPTIQCAGLCAESCGPVLMGRVEWQSLCRAGGERRVAANDLTCPYLEEERCSVYEVRPMICFLPEAWVYTHQGPMQIKDILAGDLCFGPDGGLHRVIGTSSRLYEGPICDVRHTGTHVSCWSTADHLWLTARQKDKRKDPDPLWAQASGLIPKRQHQAGDYLCFPRRFQDNKPAASVTVRDYISGQPLGDRVFPHSGGSPTGVQQSIPEVIAVDDEFLFLLGIYLAEGSATVQSMHLTMNSKEMNHIKRVANYLESIGITSSISTKRNTANLSVGSALLGRLMKSLCGVGAPNKRITPSLFGELSHAQKWKIYQAWDVGDGRKCKKNEMSTTTTSEWLAVQMGFTALCVGLFPRTYVVCRSDRNGTAYDVHLFPSNWRDTKEGYGTKNMVDDRFIYSPAAGTGGKEQYRRGGLNQATYSGPVIDLQIEDVESFVTSSGIAHNCRLWGIVETMKCEWGCVPERYLTHEEGFEFLERAREIQS